MRILLLIVYFYFLSTAIQGQPANSSHLILFTNRIDSIEASNDSLFKEQVFTRIKLQLNQIPISDLSDYVKLICDNTNKATFNRDLYFRMLYGATSVYYDYGKPNIAIEELERIAKNTLAPASTLLTAIISDWKCRNLEFSKRLPDAIQYAKSSLQNFISLNEYGSACNGFTHVAMLYSKLNLSTESISWHKRGLEYAKKHKIPVWESLISGNLGHELLKNGDTSEAIHYLNYDLATGKKLNMYSSVANTWILLSKIALKRGQSSLRKAYLDSATHYVQLAWPDKTPFDPTFIALYDQLADWYLKQGDLKKAFHYQFLYYENKLGFDSLQYQKLSTDLAVKLEKEYRQKEIDLLHSDLNQKSSLNRLYGVLVAALVMFLGTLLYFLDFQRKKTKQERETNTHLEALNQLKDRMFSVISHDLRSPLASLSGLLELFNQPDLSEQEKAYFMEEVRIQLGATMNLLDNLLQWSMLQFQGETMPKPLLINLGKEVNELRILTQGQANRKHIRLITSIPEDLMVKVDLNHFQLILRNLLGNAIKFSHPDSEIVISAGVHGNYVRVNVIDHGVGMTEEVVSSLFKRSTYHTTFGTGGEKGAGLGLSLCFEYANLNHGKLEVSSTLGKGSTFRLYLPFS